MASLKIEIDPTNPNVQIYGKYRYNTELGCGNLSSVSKRKHYPDMLSMDRPEKSIIDAIENYKNELETKRGQ